MCTGKMVSAQQSAIAFFQWKLDLNASACVRELYYDSYKCQMEFLFYKANRFNWSNCSVYPLSSMVVLIRELNVLEKFCYSYFTADRCVTD